MWDHLTDALDPRILATADTVQWMAMCDWFAEWRKCVAMMNSDVELDSKTYGQWFRRKRDAWNELSKITNNFGMSPAARAKIKVAPTDDGEGNPLLEMLEARGN